MAAFAFHKSYHAQQETNDCQRRIVELEEGRDAERREQEKKAILRPEVKKNGYVDYRLIIYNRGQPEARNISVNLNKKPLSAHRGQTLPRLLGPDGEISLIIGFGMGCPAQFPIEIIWDDDFSTNRLYKTTITV